MPGIPDARYLPGSRYARMSSARYPAGSRYPGIPVFPVFPVFRATRAAPFRNPRISRMRQNLAGIHGFGPIRGISRLCKPS